MESGQRFGAGIVALADKGGETITDTAQGFIRFSTVTISIGTLHDREIVPASLCRIVFGWIINHLEGIFSKLHLGAITDYLITSMCRKAGDLIGITSPTQSPPNVKRAGP